MPWGLGFFDFVFVCFGVGFIACEDLVLGLDASFDYLFRFVPMGESGFVPICFEVSGLGSPAEYALLGAVESCWGQLDALVGLDAIEFLFVAWSVVDEGFMEPSAFLDGRVVAYEVVFLTFHSFYKFR
jgi:hypothetical protein